MTSGKWTGKSQDAESGRQSVAEELATTLTDPSRREPDRHERLVRALREGQWVCWEELGVVEKRGKLAWRSEVADLLLFVDMRGRKLAELTTSELAAMFRQGRASLLADIDQPFMERALRHIQNLIAEKLGRRRFGMVPA
ncbi:MAG TPA: DUF1631 family protein [Chromatiaceae bacterium]|nr:DUF1631 family protein [Chromatiaceae bacterium]